MLEFKFEQKENGWQVTDGGKIYVYTSLQKAIKNTWMGRVFYKKPHKAMGIKRFKLIFDLGEDNNRGSK